MTLTDSVRRLFDGKNFAVLSTLEPDGRPRSTVVWTKRDVDDIVFALPKNRRKAANLIRDPRLTVVVFDAANPYESAQVQGVASIEVPLRRRHRPRSRRNHHRRARQQTARTVASYEGEKVNWSALSEMFRQIIANNRAGGWRKLQRKR